MYGSGIANLPSHLAKSIECRSYICSIALSIAFYKYFPWSRDPESHKCTHEVASMKVGNDVCPNGYKYE